jgi:3-hydroxyisobutyrate dehydrogenase-like beta-hydroxyacid dehydrogenase
MPVGFVGLGRMGQHMARNIAAAGFDLVVWNRSGEVADQLAAQIGCDAVAMPRALSDEVDIVVTMLADDAASEIVHMGQKDCSTDKGQPTTLKWAR